MIYRVFSGIIYRFSSLGYNLRILTLFLAETNEYWSKYWDLIGGKNISLQISSNLTECNLNISNSKLGRSQSCFGAIKTIQCLITFNWRTNNYCVYLQKVCNKNLNFKFSFIEQLIILSTRNFNENQEKQALSLLKYLNKQFVE